MRYYLSEHAELKLLEEPCVYDICNDELYELDLPAFDFLLKSAGPSGADPNEADSGFISYCIAEGLLQGKSIRKKIRAVVQSPIPSLRYLELQITDKCNLKCRHCYVGASRNIEIPLEQLKSVLDEFESMQGLRLLITGGEPLLHSRFSDFNSMLPDYGCRKILFTNGLLLENSDMKSLNVDEIQFSVDGMESGHDAIRGAGTFRKVMNKIETAIASGLAVSAATMVHKENMSELEDLQKLVLDLGIKDWTVDIPCQEGNLKSNKALLISPEEGGRFLEYGFGKGLHGSAEGYGCGLHLAAVNADGQVCKCSFYRESPMGHIKDGLAAAWKNIEPVRLSALECRARDCKYIEECRGGCRYRASTLNGSSDNLTNMPTLYGAGRDFYKCFYYGIMK